MNTCPSGKRSFPHVESAQSAADHLTYSNKHMKKKGRKKTVARVYQCPMCGFWHMTSQPQRGVA